MMCFLPRGGEVPQSKCRRRQISWERVPISSAACSVGSFCRTVMQAAIKAPSLDRPISHHPRQQRSPSSSSSSLARRNAREADRALTLAAGKAAAPQPAPGSPAPDGSVSVPPHPGTRRSGPGSRPGAGGVVTGHRNGRAPAAGVGRPRASAGCARPSVPWPAEERRRLAAASPPSARGCSGGAALPSHPRPLGSKLREQPSRRARRTRDRLREAEGPAPLPAGAGQGLGQSSPPEPARGYAAPREGRRCSLLSAFATRVGRPAVGPVAIPFLRSRQAAEPCPPPGAGDGERP